MARTRSPFKQTISQFAGEHPDLIEERFEPLSTGIVVPGDEPAYGSRIFMCGTYALEGGLCAAVYASEGPAKTRETTEDIIHSRINLALLLRHAGEGENHDALQTAVRRQIRPDLAARFARLFEGLIPRTDWDYNGQPILQRTGYQSASFLPL